MPEKNPDHWLYRLSDEEWLRAAEGELLRAREALREKQRRTGVAEARRAAGMAWNALLVREEDETGYGRSYMDHLRVIVETPALPPPVQEAARVLLSMPLVTNVISIGVGRLGDTTAASAAETIVEYARAYIAGNN